MIGEDAPELWIRDRRRAYIVRRRIGVRKAGEGGSKHGKNPCYSEGDSGVKAGRLLPKPDAGRNGSDYAE